MEFMLIVGLVIGGILGWFIAKSKFKIGQKFTDSDYQTIYSEKTSLMTEKAVLKEKLDDIGRLYDKDIEELENSRTENVTLKEQIATMKSDYDHLQDKLTEQKGEIEKIQERFKEEFENLANRILKQTTQEFTNKNKEKLDEILNPFKTKIDEFRGKVEQIHTEELKQRQELKTEMTNLLTLNQQLSDDANNLTKALKGESKVIGDWGQLVLERVLEESGLRKNEEYYLQPSYRNKEGNLVYPDCVIRLPDERDIIVDSKVSIAAYERYVSAQTEDEIKKAIKEHLTSIKKHIDELSSKEYHEIEDLNSLDYVMMFVPIEPAYILAMKEDPTLINYAFSRGISLISASNLIAVIKITSCLWQMQHQSEHVMEIAERGGALYDKFVGFVEDLQNIGKHLDKTREAYDNSMNKLATGRGNLVRQTEMMRELGAKAKKQIPSGILQVAFESDESAIPNRLSEDE